MPWESLSSSLRPSQEFNILDLSSNPIVVSSEELVFEHPKRNAVNEVIGVTLRSMKNQVVPSGESEVERLALVTGEHH